MPRADYTNPYDWHRANGGYIAEDSSSWRDGKWYIAAKPGESWPGVERSMYNPKGERLYFKTWDDLTKWAKKNLGVKGWRRMSVNRMSFWVPDNASTDRPCEITVNSGDSRSASFHPCGKLAVAVGRSAYGTEGEVPICKFHQSVASKVAERDRVRREAWDARRDEDRRNAELSQASKDWAKRLSDEYGVVAEGMRCHGELRVKVAPEHLYSKLVDLHGLLRDAGMSDDDIKEALR